jgi:DNA polymerase III delta prime subunit
MFWALIIMSIFPIFELDKFTRRDIRKYNREIKRIERSIFKENTEWQELEKVDGDMLQGILLLQKVGLAHIPTW